MTDVNHLSYGTWLAYGVGHVLNDVCASMWFTYFLIFFKSVLQFDDKLAGTALFIGQLADGISTPIVGFLADKHFDHWLFKYGRKKFWHLLGTFCVIVSFPFIFSPCFGCTHSYYGLKLIYYSFFIIIFQFGWASVQVSHLSLVPDLTPNEHERTSLLSIRYSFTVLSNMAVYFVLWNVLRYNRVGEDTPIGPGDDYKFQIVAYIVVALGTLMSVLFHLKVKDKSSSESYQTIHSQEVTRSSLLKNWSIYESACVYMSTRLFVNLSLVYIPLYLHTALKLPSEKLAIFPFVMFISGYVTSFLIKPLNVELGRKFTYIFGALLGIGTCIWIRVGKDYYYQNFEIYGVIIACGCASSLMIVTNLGIIADLIGTNTNTGGFVYGIMSFCDKISNGIAILIIEYIQSEISFDFYYRDVLFYASGGAAFIGLITILFIKISNRIVEARENDEIEQEDSIPAHEEIFSPN